MQVDLWTQLQAAPGWEAGLEDGLHLSPKGSAAAFKVRCAKGRGALRMEKAPEKGRGPLRRALGRAHEGDVEEGLHLSPKGSATTCA